MKRTIKVLSLVLALTLCFALFAGCNKDKADNSKARTFTVGFDANFPPYGYVDNGEYVGFDLDLAAEICERNNWELKLQAIEWSAKDTELDSGAIDCIWNGFTMTADRLPIYSWTDAYVDNSQVFVVATNSGITSQADLSGKTVIVQATSSAEDALNSEDSAELRASFKDLVAVPDYNTAFMNLEAGAADAIAMDIGVAKYQLSIHEGYMILDEALISEYYGVAFKKGNTELCDTVQNTLGEMAEDGTLAEIATEWGLQDSVVWGTDGSSFEEICQNNNVTIG